MRSSLFVSQRQIFLGDRKAGTAAEICHEKHEKLRKRTGMAARKFEI
jgi:hypothetical protein